jgi:hypothetical protein
MGSYSVFGDGMPRRCMSERMFHESQRSQGKEAKDPFINIPKNLFPQRKGFLGKKDICLVYTEFYMSNIIFSRSWIIEC